MFQPHVMTQVTGQRRPVVNEGSGARGRRITVTNGNSGGKTEGCCSKLVKRKSFQKGMIAQVMVKDGFQS